MIEVKNLAVTLNNYEILRNINLEIHDNEFVAIMGSSGSGKTTLLNTIGLLEKASQGEIKIDGREVTKMSNHKRMQMLRDEIGFLFQDFGLIDELSIYENVIFCIRERKDRYKKIQKALEEVDLKIDSKKKVYLLSGGERQRVGIARLLLKKCKYVLCDEPTGSLDSENSQNIIQLFKKLQKNGKTVIMVTHDEMMAKAADRIIYLDELKEV